MTLSTVERQNSAGVRGSFPLRVLSFDLDNLEEGFSEDTQALTIFHSGACVPLRNPVSVGDFLRIVNLTNYSEADFRIIGSIGTTPEGVTIWGVERQEGRSNFWGTGGPSPSLQGAESLDLQCRVCGKHTAQKLTPVESEVLNSTGLIALDCDICGKPTYWTDPNRPPNESIVDEMVAPPRRADQHKKIEKRTAKRSQMKLPILVRTEAGEQEIAKTIDISKLGVCLPLYMTLKIGETLGIVCPYDSPAGGIEQKAEVCWRSQYYNQDFPRMYGLRFVR
jgi:hypothetical protein